jgi:hypothetical protein
MPTRTTRKPALLTFHFNSKERQWHEVQVPYKPDINEPLEEAPHPKAVNYRIMYFPPPHNALEMMHTPYARNIKGCLKALKKELRPSFINSLSTP